MVNNKSFQISKKKNEIIDNFLLANKNCILTIDTRTVWPANVSQIEAYFSDIYSKIFFEKFKNNPKEFEKALNTLRMFTIHNMLHHSKVAGLKVLKKFENYPITQKEMVDFIVFMLNVAKKKSKGKLFCLNEDYKILDNKEINKINENLIWTKSSDLTTKKEIGNLIVSLDSLIWSLYFDPYRSAGSEIHGPYLVDNYYILIRDYFDLNPKEIWPIKNKYLSVKMYLKYPKDIGIKINFIDQVNSSKPLGKELISFSVLVDGKNVVSSSEINFLFKYFSILTESQSQKVNKLIPLEIIKKGAEIYYYSNRDFFKYYKEDWRPSREVYDRIDSWGLKFWNQYKNSEKVSINFFMKLFDPRNDFIE